ncbi:Expansin-B1 [Auxenochlorella protothecoides]|uniref:Expansin-B1 n=1 Tax=Auxenochlorella protothecoides TaxID=3075 RepID=A0A087SMZ4_AUXPR|nr:Expansin-B1 [Auxenochlorella protothecoides]KFM27098.1 Expansin-B1 [Auxenochlorella protothecoides]
MSVSRRLGFLLALLAVAKGQTNWTPVTVGSAASGGDSPAGSGACGYGTLSASSWPYDAIAVVNPDSPFLAGSAPQGCGTCLEIQCTDEVCGSAAGAFVALVTDNCDGCDLSQIYVSPTAYAKSFSPSIGLATGRATAVPCAPPGDIVVRIDTFRPTLGGYLRLVLLSVAGQGPIDSVELRTSGSQGDWAPLARSFGAAWDASSLPSLPLDIRITRGGDTLIVQSAITEEGQLGDIQTGVQFGGASSGLVNGVNSVLDTPAVEPSPEEALALPGLEPGPESAAAGVISLLPGGQAPAAETNVGLAVLLDAPDAQATLLVPTNSALDAAIAGGSVRDADTLAALLNSAPDLANPLAAYHVVKGLWPSWTLAPGTRLPTSATLDKVNLLQLNVTAGPVIRGVGSSANVLQADLLACGPSVIHIIDQVLLPFNFDQASLDAITATQVPVPPAAPSPAVTPAGRRLMRV